MNNTTKWIIGLVIVVVILWGGSTLLRPKEQNQEKEPVAKNTEPIKVGFIGALSGDVATIGENLRAALEIAKDETNAAGGINGRQIEMIYEDGKCNPKDAANAGNKLINIDKVKYIVGGLCSSETLAVAPMAELAKVVMISPASTNPSISQAGDYIFRDVPSDSFQGIFMAEYVKNTMKKTKVATVKCLSDWCIGVNDAFKAHFLELGGQIVAEEGYTQDSKDLRTQLTKVKAAKPEMVYFIGYTEGSIVGLRQMKELGIAVPVVGADAWSDMKIWQEVKGAGEGAMYTEPANKELPQEFVAKMAEKLSGVELNVYAPRGYDALKMLAMAIGTGEDDVQKVKNALYAIKDYQGIADNYSFDANGDIVNAKYVVKKIQSGKAVDVK